jgi:hypothetical protein
VSTHKLQVGEARLERRTIFEVVRLGRAADERLFDLDAGGR